jgi:hypothetical protein
MRNVLTTLQHSLEANSSRPAKDKILACLRTRHAPSLALGKGSSSQTLSLPS